MFSFISSQRTKNKGVCGSTTRPSLISKHDKNNNSLSGISNRPEKNLRELVNNGTGEQTFYNLQIMAFDLFATLRSESDWTE